MGRRDFAEAKRLQKEQKEWQQTNSQNQPSAEGKKAPRKLMPRLDIVRIVPVTGKSYLDSCAPVRQDDKANAVISVVTMNAKEHLLAAIKRSANTEEGKIIIASATKLLDPLPKELQRCYRCLERGHPARDCIGELSVRCGQKGYKSLKYVAEMPLIYTFTDCDISSFRSAPPVQRKRSGRLVPSTSSSLMRSWSMSVSVEPSSRKA
uniref:Uncharacterized protein n=1 Tax=Anopheles albimanus TaxID=7167 RepID=A0A182FMI4_ANOAL